MENAVQTLYTGLKNLGVNVYSPSQHSAACPTPYCVLKLQNKIRFGDFSSNTRYLDVLCYTPKNDYAKVLDYQHEIESYMKSVQDKLMIRDTGTTTTPYFDTAVNGWMTSVQYALYERRK